MDDKVGVVSILEAIEALLAEGFQPRRTHYSVFGHDEEVGGGRGASAIADLLATREVEPYACVIDEGGLVARGMVPGLDGAVALIGTAEKGYVNLELLVEGDGGHSSTPPESTNIGILAAAISRVEETPFPAHLEGPAPESFAYIGAEIGFLPRVVFANLWLFGPVVKRLMLMDPSSASSLRTTTAVTIVEGGVKANVLPIRARAVVNHRIRPGETISSASAKSSTRRDSSRASSSSNS
jgi:carboxypeptidase PM20D1